MVINTGTFISRKATWHVMGSGRANQKKIKAEQKNPLFQRSF
jgi:hypothetical protein